MKLELGKENAKVLMDALVCYRQSLQRSYGKSSLPEVKAAFARATMVVTDLIVLVEKNNV